MRNRMALVVEDDDRIIDQIEDTLFSLGHRCERAASQAEAQQKLEGGTYDYVLLDLHIPARPGRGGASAEFGLHLLRSIRQSKGPMAMPVIIMTGQGAACVDLMSELTRLGPSEFISKPWPEKGRTLAAVVKEVLRGSADNQVAGLKVEPAKHKAKFAGGTLVYYPTRIEILGRVITEESQRGNFWNVLQCLRQKKDDCFRAFSGSRLGEHFKGGKASQNTVASCVGDLRARLMEVLVDAGVEAGEQDVIITDRPGYRFREWIKIEIRNAEHATPSAEETPEVNLPYAASPVGSALSERQLWVIEELRKGIALQRAELQKRFDVTSKTAKRDLADLAKRGLIVFVRTPQPGHYALAKR